MKGDPMDDGWRFAEIDLFRDSPDARSVGIEKLALTWWAPTWSVDLPEHVDDRARVRVEVVQPSGQATVLMAVAPIGRAGKIVEVVTADAKRGSRLRLAARNVSTASVRAIALYDGHVWRGPEVTVNASTARVDDVAVGEVSE